jgi:hypothetical protein
MQKIPKSCPACDSRLIVTELSCPSCGTEVRGQFEFDLFSRLSPTDFDFVVLFLKTKGNIKEMERELGISYWTIRSKLGEIVEQLGLEEPEETPEAGEAVAARRQAVLDQLSDGSISVEEAAAQLQRLKKKRGN